MSYDLDDLQHHSKDDHLRSILEEAYTIGAKHAPDVDTTDETAETEIQLHTEFLNSDHYDEHIIPRIVGLEQKLVEHTECDKLAASQSISSAIMDGFFDSLRNEVNDDYFKLSHDYVKPVTDTVSR